MAARQTKPKSAEEAAAPTAQVSPLGAVSDTKREKKVTKLPNGTTREDY